MRNATLWRALLGIEKAVVEDVEFDEDFEVLVAHVRPRKRGVAGVIGAGGAHRPPASRERAAHRPCVLLSPVGGCTTGRRARCLHTVQPQLVQQR